MSVTYKILGVSVGTLLIGSTALTIRKRNRDERTGKLLSAIKAQIQPIHYI